MFERQLALLGNGDAAIGWTEDRPFRSGYGITQAIIRPFRRQGPQENVVSLEGAIRVRVAPVADGDADELAELTARLRAELILLEFQAESDAPAETDGSPDRLTKGTGALAAVGHWLLVQLGGLGLRSALAAIGDWATRSDREVEASVTTADGGTRTLKLGRATPEQQAKIIDAWLSSLSPGT